MPDTAHAMRTEDRRPQRERAETTLRPGGSLMTLLERACYLNPDPGGVNVTHGYPEGLNPGWIREHQLHLPAGWLDIPPAEFTDAIAKYFRRFLGVDDVYLTPTCSLGFAIAVQTVIRAPGDEVIVLDRSFDCWPVLLSELRAARVVYARRTADGLPDVDSIAAACTERTRAVVIVSPDNPLGIVCPHDVMEQLVALCKQRDITLLADHCLAELNPYRVAIPLLPRLAASKGLSWITLADTGKLLGLNGSKFGALACSPGWRDAIDAAASAWFFHHAQYDLAVVSAIVSDLRFLPYRLEISNQIAVRHQYLREKVPAPLTVATMGAGSFCLIDAAGLGMDDVSFAALLRDRYRVLVVPASWFPSGRRAAETRVRVTLARSWHTIERLAAALSDAASTRAGPAMRPAW